MKPVNIHQDRNSMVEEMATRKRYDELCKKKNEIESTIKELNDLLESQGGVGLTGPLVDQEGFPRSDIDVYSCRHARHQLSCLQNDHIAVMKDIEETLYAIHAEASAASSQSDTAMEVESEVDLDKRETDRKPFAVVDRVDPGSPASSGGLEADDKLVEFGSVTTENFADLRTITQLLQHSKNKALNLLVLRKGRHIKLTLTPAAWNGPGLLGCNIKPLA